LQPYTADLSKAKITSTKHTPGKQKNYSVAVGALLCTPLKILKFLTTSASAKKITLFINIIFIAKNS